MGCLWWILPRFCIAVNSTDWAWTMRDPGSNQKQSWEPCSHKNEVRSMWPSSVHNQTLWLAHHWLPHSFIFISQQQSPPMLYIVMKRATVMQTPPPTALPRTCNALHLLLKVDSLKEPGKHMGTVAECAVPTRFHITSGTFTATRYFLGLSQAVLWSVWTLPNFKRFYVHIRASFFIQFHCDSIPVQQLEGEATP